MLMPIKSLLCYLSPTPRYIPKGRLAKRITQMLPWSGYKYLYVHWHLHRMGQSLPHAIREGSWGFQVPPKRNNYLFDLPESLQGANGPFFIAKVTQSLSIALGINYKPHASWSPQSSGKVEKMNHTLNKTLQKFVRRFMSLGPNCFVLHSSHHPETSLRLSPLEMTYAEPFLTADILLDGKISQG